MDKKSKKYKDDYSLRTLAYYQRKGGIYNELITILQRIRNDKGNGRRLAPAKVLNQACEMYERCLEYNIEEGGKIVDSGFEDVAVEFWGGCIAGPMAEYNNKDQILILCTLLVLLAQVPAFQEATIPDIYALIGKDKLLLYFNPLIESLLKSTPSDFENIADFSVQLVNLRKDLQAKERIISLKDSEIKDMDNRIKQLTELLEVLSITVERYKNDEIKRSNFDRILNLDTILKFAETRKSYKRAAPIFNMLTHLAFNTATEVEDKKIVSTENKLLEINETEVAIFNENKAFGSNLFTGIVNSPYFPMGVDETTIMKGLLPIIEDYFKHTYGDGARRENKD